VAKIKKINHGNYLYKKSFFSKIDAAIILWGLSVLQSKKSEKDHSGGSGLEKEDIPLCHFDFR